MRYNVDYIDGEKFESLADISFGDQFTTNRKIDMESIVSLDKKVPLVFCSSDNVLEFVNKIDTTDIIVDLISHNGDRNFTYMDVQNRPKNIRCWYSQNMAYSDSNVLPL